MGLTNPGRDLGRSCLLSISPKLLTLSGILPFSTNSFRLASFLALLVGLDLSFLIGALVWFFKITKVVPFESVEVFRKDPFLALYFSLSLLMTFRPLCNLPSAALFTLTIWPFGPPPPRSQLRWRPHEELCFDWSAGLSTGFFLSIRANVRPCSFQWIPTKLNSSPTSSFSAPTSVSTPLQLFLGSPSTALENRAFHCYEISFFGAHWSANDIIGLPRLPISQINELKQLPDFRSSLFDAILPLMKASQKAYG